MKTFRIVPVLLMLFIAMNSCESDEEDFLFNSQLNTVEDKNDLHKSQLQNRAFRSESLTGNFIGNHFVRKMQVYTPPGYKESGTRSYPVVYLLHGLPFSEKTYIDQDIWDPWVRPGEMWPFQEYPDFPDEGFREWMDKLIAEGKVEPMIIVMPNAASEAGYGFSFYTNSILNGDFEDYLIKDLVTYMDSHYNTIAHRSGRSVIGHSQGGYAAFKFGLLRPDVFGTVASHSGLLLLDAVLSLSPDLIQENPNGFEGPDPEKFLTSAAYAMSSAWSPNLNNPPFYVDFPIDYATGAVIPEVAHKWYAHDVFSLLDTYLANFKSLDGIYLDLGLYDEVGLGPAYPYLIQKLDALGVTYTYETFEGGHFTQTFERLAVSLAFCSDSMKP